MSIFSVRLRELRGSESQASFATAIGIHRVQYVNYEAGKNAPSVEVLERICRVHACSADWLLGLKDNQESAGSVKASSGGIAIGGVGNRVTGTIVAGISAEAEGRAAKRSLEQCDAGHAAICKSCPYKKWGEKLRKQGLVIPGVDSK